MKNKWDNQDPMSCSGVQLGARHGTSHGMYVFSGWCDPLNYPTVTGLFLQSIQPPVIYYPKLDKLWRWTEYDWEFVPHTTSTFIERTECVGTFPNAECKGYLANNSILDSGLTDDILAEKIGVESRHEDIKSWQDLVSRTGNNSTGNMYWQYADDWQKPRAVPAPTKEPFMTINFWRSPEGAKKVDANGVKDAAFVPGRSETVSGAAMTNEQYVTAKDANGKITYDPKEFHTYTIVWTPEELSYYIDATERGKGIENATPIRTLNYKIILV